MSDFQFGNVSMLHGLWLVPFLASLMVYAARRRRQALRAFVEAGLLARLGHGSRPDPARRVLKAALALLALGCLVVALARPAWDAVEEEVSQRGRDVVFLLDVSRSMLAQDLPPSRLERAKLAIRDATDQLDGDRVALAVFAGSTVVKCPLTLDYSFFRMALDDVSGHSVARGGSLIGDGLRTVLGEVFDAKRSNYRDIVLITDGEDHDSFPVEAAAAAGDLGIRLIAIGLGDERVGQRIPVAPGGDRQARPREGPAFLRHDGREVWSRLDADTLRRMADATPGGLYLNVSTGAIDLGEVYRRLIAPASGRDIGTRTIDRLEERFQVFLAICLLLLALETFLRERGRAPAVRGLGACLLVATLAPSVTQAASVRSLVNGGNDAFRAEEYEDALRSYEQALEQDSESPYAALNRANALYRTGDFAAAAEGYAEALRKSSDRDVPGLRAAGLHSLGNALYRQAEQVAGTDPRQAIDLLVPAARSYLDALRADGRRGDSAHNLELARRLLQRLREQAGQQPQSGGQSGEHGDPESQQGEERDRSEQLQKAAEQQERLANESRDLDEDRQENPGSDSRERQEQRAQDLAEQQETLNRDTERLRQNADPRTREDLDDAARNQEEAQRQLERNRPDEAEQAQRDAAEALRRAAQGEPGEGEESQQAQAEQGSPAEIQPPDTSAREQQMTMEQILAKEERDRKRRQMRQRVGVAAVEKDW